MIERSRCCHTPAYSPWEQDPTLHRCVTCGNIRYYGPDTMRCVICEKLLMKNRDPDEMTRLLQAGVFELRQIQLSFGVSDKWGKKVQRYPVCSECIEKEQAEEEGGGGGGKKKNDNLR